MNHNVYIVDDAEDLLRSTTILLTAHGFSAQPFNSAVQFLVVAPTLPPGLVLMDLHMPDLSGLEALPLIHRASPSLRIVMVTAHGDVRSAVAALKSGAVDFLQKPYSEDELVGIVNAELEQLNAASDQDELEKRARQRITLLSEREAQVVQALVRGKQSKVIAHQLGLSPRTIEMHRARAMARMHCRTLSDLIATAVRGGIA